MRAEGFTDVRYVKGDKSVDQSEWIARGETDFSVNFPPNQIASIDAGVPIKVLTGLHSGCLELIANGEHPQRHGSAGQEGGRGRFQ